MISPRSCDTFVVLPSLTKNGDVIFGKNSDRPQNEVQEVVFIRGGEQEFKLKVCNCGIFIKSLEYQCCIRFLVLTICQMFFYLN